MTTQPATPPRALLAAHIASLSPLERELLGDDIELDLTGGCSACGLERNHLCACCGLCNCDDHDTCVRPAEPAASAG